MQAKGGYCTFVGKQGPQLAMSTTALGFMSKSTSPFGVFTFPSTSRSPRILAILFCHQHVGGQGGPLILCWHQHQFPFVLSTSPLPFVDFEMNITLLVRSFCLGICAKCKIGHEYCYGDLFLCFFHQHSGFLKRPLFHRCHVWTIYFPAGIRSNQIVHQIFQHH